jgi:DNA-binding transcriptional LysR family regulator
MAVFVSVVEFKSLTAAAHKMNISRSMATRHIADLEKSLGVRLLHRSTRSLGVTHSGEKLLPYCRAILKQTEQLYSTAQQQQTVPEGKITISSSFSFGQLYLGQAIDHFIKLYPNVVIDLRLSDNVNNIINDGIDIAIEVGNHLPEQLIGKKLADCPSIICATPEYLAKHGVPQNITDLQQHNCLVHRKLGNIWTFFNSDTVRDAQSTQIEVNSNYMVNDTTILLNATLAGRGIACLPQPFINEHLHTGQLTQILPTLRVNPIGIWALYASRDYQPKLHRYLLEFLHQDLTHRHEHRQ